MQVVLWLLSPSKMYTIRPSVLTDSVFQTDMDKISQVAEAVITRFGSVVGCLHVYHHSVEGHQIEWKGRMYQIHPPVAIGSALCSLLGMFDPSELYIVADVEGDEPTFDMVLGKTCNAIMEEYTAIQFEADLITT
jgi:hypothetical protein